MKAFPPLVRDDSSILRELWGIPACLPAPFLREDTAKWWWITSAV